MKIKIIFFVLFVAFVASCAVKRDCKPPELNLPEQIVRGIDADSITIADLHWWEYYGDTLLCRIIEKTLDNNRELLAAAAKVEQMRQLYRIDKANFAPDFKLFAFGDDERYEYHNADPKREVELSLKGTVSWEIDFWGSLRWAKKKGEAEYLNTLGNQRAMQMLLVAEVATAYFRLVALDNELAIVRRTLTTRGESEFQAKVRFEGGLTSETVYQQAKVEYATTASLIPDLESRIKITENSIALLMGEYPDWEVIRSEMNTHPDFPDSIPIGLPTGLLQRRPDVRASEQNLRAAMADAGIAYADRFPKLTISLTGGWENNVFTSYFQSPFTYLAGSLASPVFGFGRKLAKYKAAVAAYDEARLKYEQKVLEVFKEANDAVITYKKSRETLQLMANLCDASKKYVDLAHLQYRSGSINYIDVLDAHRRYFSAQIALSNAVRDEHLALVQLYKVLGGGWQL